MGIKVEGTRQRSFDIVNVLEDATRVDDCLQNRRVNHEPVDGAAEYHTLLELPHINPVLLYCYNTISAL
jgi:hypothetical protein